MHKDVPSRMPLSRAPHRTGKSLSERDGKEASDSSPDSFGRFASYLNDMGQKRAAS